MKSPLAELNMRYFNSANGYLRVLVLFYTSFLSNFVCSKQGFNFTNTLQKTLHDYGYGTMGNLQAS